MSEKSIKINWHPTEFLKKLNVTLADKLNMSAEYVMNKAKVETPVITGKLRSSIFQKTDKDTLTAIVGSNVDYAWYVEVGTIKMTPRKYLRRGLTIAKPMIKKIFNKPLAMIGASRGNDWRP